MVVLNNYTYKIIEPTLNLIVEMFDEFLFDEEELYLSIINSELNYSLICRSGNIYGNSYYSDKHTFEPYSDLWFKYVKRIKKKTIDRLYRIEVNKRLSEIDKLYMVMFNILYLFDYEDAWHHPYYGDDRHEKASDIIKSKVNFDFDKWCIRTLDELPQH